MTHERRRACSVSHARLRAFRELKTASLRNQILNGRLKARKVGRDWLVDVNDLEAYLDGRSAGGRRAATEKQLRRVRRAAA
jgi:hypothetical protein